jgi:hypothetical protein
MKTALSILPVVILASAALWADEPDRINALDRVPADAPNRFYVSNRAPLAASPLAKLPIGSITPQGWLRRQLELEAQGMVGHLDEVSHWSRFEGNAWSDPKGKGLGGWEEAPYWLKGLGDLGYVLKDERIIKEARRWVEAILASQDESGWFGPRSLLTSLDGKPDLWPNMLALNVLQSYYEATGDARVLPFLARYFQWQLRVPEQDFLVGYWPPLRGGDNLETVYWLYNRTGDASLLDLARKIHKRTSDWTGGVANLHGVNFTQGFREPAEFWMQAREPRFLDATERNYQTMMGLYGQVPGGGFGADENARPGFVDPRQGFETCSMVEFMHSFELLTRVTGHPVWADRCEDVAFNSLPAALTPDLKGLHYLTCPNQVQLDPGDKSPGIQNGGNMFAYSPGEVFRCCQHNVAMGWPYFAEELWLATADNGLCATMYSPCEVTAKVGDGTVVMIREVTDYPFRDTIHFTILTPKPVAFPLYIRRPRWCEKVTLSFDRDPQQPFRKSISLGRPQGERDGDNGWYAVLLGTWSDGDQVHLKLPMTVDVRTWKKNHDSVSVDRGPLTYALKIGETWKRIGGSDRWPDHSVMPSTAWNYGLVLDDKNPAASFEVHEKEGPLADQPFTPEHAPIRLTANAKRIPAWTTDSKGLVQELQPSPVKSDEPTEKVTLIPMGAARLRISSFPVIGTGPDAHAWRTPPTVKASWCFANDTPAAVADGKLPRNSNDQEIPRFTWWDHKGTDEWLEYDLPARRRVSKVNVYWFDDRSTGGGCRVPESWRLLYRSGGTWKPVAGASVYRTQRDGFNSVTFDPVETDALRVLVRLQPEFSSGVLEWTIE